ncbi:RagB/SusD family nutrient uptake outer membrane protein [Chryseobacterium sp.]|uniref:RagB/SusD family nutrient uptake outer membrane protein n=1 Tax=Chryseobacterium sp. TaxID=1871047 RepID=UPI0025B8FC13|nr:RagB/SusD family nutrient uptake outer membrane protein [Chryseobacterium sp.]MBV8328801.1 RagB/SusD family nutrient uptake outer membrane protein [Chryseobacterium sp.]
MKKLFSASILALSLALVTTSCSNDFVETTFYQEKQAAPIGSIEELTSFINGTFAKMRSINYYGRNFLAYAEVHTDEAYTTGASGRNVAWGTYSFTSLDGDVTATWRDIYLTVANANVVINTPDTGLTWGESSDPAVIKDMTRYIKGQAYAVRAQAFFDLLRLYGQQYSGGSLGIVLPLVYDPNAKMKRASIAETQAQIESDFANAILYMNDDTEENNGSPVYLNPYSVKALMSRYYLYKGDYAKVRQYAGDVIASGSYSVIQSGDLLKSFASNANSNSVFEIAVGTASALSFDSYSNLVNSGGYQNIRVLPSVVSLYSSNDPRLKLLTSRYLNGKFPDITGAGNIKMVRYEEVLLNAAEAELNGGSAANALTYYNTLIQARSQTPAAAVTLNMVKTERIKELVGEGFRYWDLLRWGQTIPYYNTSGVADAAQNKTIPDKKLTFPIPQSETNVAGTLVVSNPGYDN